MILLDANVLLEIVRNRPKTKQALRLVRAHEDCAVSDWAIAEAVAALAQQIRERKLTLVDAERALEELEGWATSWQRVDVVSADVREATRLLRGFDLNVRAPDALHVVMAIRLDSGLATFDTKLANAAVALGVTVHRP